MAGVRKSSTRRKRNPWISFLKKHKSKGLSMNQLRSLWKTEGKKTRKSKSRSRSRSKSRSRTGKGYDGEKCGYARRGRGCGCKKLDEKSALYTLGGAALGTATIGGPAGLVLGGLGGYALSGAARKRRKSSTRRRRRSSQRSR